MGSSPSKAVILPGTCNGHASYCTTPWSELSEIGTHNSAFHGPLPSANQDWTVTQQLDAGIRFLQGQSHWENNKLQMCHTNCLLYDGGSAVDYLNRIKTWMDVNPNEVVTLLLTNADRVDVNKYGDAMKQSGLQSYAYTPPKRLAMNEWPTLQELIVQNKRLVMFLDYKADTNYVPYILDEFHYFFETPFENTDPDFSSCDLDRPSGSNGDGLMYIVNHFLQVKIGDIFIPNEILLPRTNAATGRGSIGAQVDVCKNKWGRKPKAVLVDRFNRGNVFPAQNASNGV